MKPIQPGMKACASDGSRCAVVDVLVDPHDGTEHDVVLSAHGYFGPDVVAPLSAVWCVDDRVHLDLSATDVTTLPPYHHETYCRAHGLFSRAAARHSGLRTAHPHRGPRGPSPDPRVRALVTPARARQGPHDHGAGDGATASEGATTCRLSTGVRP